MECRYVLPILGECCHFMMLHSPGRAVNSPIALRCFYFMKLG